MKTLTEQIQELKVENIALKTENNTLKTKTNELTTKVNAKANAYKLVWRE